MSPEEVREDLLRRVDAIEAGYEYMLAYAVQGITQDAGASSGSPIREFLRRFDDALTGFADLYRRVVDHDFLDVLARDASSAQSAIRLVLAQPAISSALVDNLNTSIHVRALLTDVFLIDEVVKPQS